MNKNIILVMILSLTLNISITQAAPAVGSGFTYQGELIDNGSPANGDYEVTLALFAQLTGGTDFGTLIFTPVTITNGLFTIDDVDFGDAVYADNNQFYIEIAVKEVGTASFDTLTPRQRLQAVPYAVQAEFLAAGGASSGDVLQFNGGDWVATALNVNSPWTDNGSSVSYLDRVGVGVVNNNFGFQVKQTDANIDPVEVTDSTGVGMFRIKNNGDVGIRIVNPQARLHLNAAVGNDPFRVDVGFQEKFLIDADGRTIIGDDPILPNFNANAKLGINEVDGENPLSVKRNDLLELLVEKDGGVSIGTHFTGSFPPQVAPDRGLYVFGDFKTSNISNGMVRYMVAAFCGGVGTNIQRSYTTVLTSGGAVSISNVALGICDITFPTTINDRFLLSSALNGTSAAKTVNCSYISTDTVRCRRYNTSDSNFSSGNITLFIY